MCACTEVKCQAPASKVMLPAGVGQFQNGDIVTVASRVGTPHLAISEPASSPPTQRVDNQPTYPSVEDSLLKS